MVEQKRKVLCPGFASGRWKMEGSGSEMGCNLLGHGRKSSSVDH
jgi:hypothetical protein